MPYRDFEHRLPKIRRAERIFRNDDCLADYQSGINFFHRQLSRLYSTLYAMERIREFPWDLFRFFFGQPIFLRLIYLNFYEYAVVSLHKLTNDQTKDVKGSYTLKRFKNTIRNDLVEVKYQKILDRRLREVKFDPKIEDITKRIKDLRDNLMAHSNRMWLGQTEDLTIQDIPANVRFSELRELTDALEDLYEAVNFQVSADAVPEKSGGGYLTFLAASSTNTNLARRLTKC